MDKKKTTNEAVLAKRLIVFSVCLTLSAFLLGLAFSIYSHDTSGWASYTYTAPLTGHEIGVIFMGVIGIVGLIYSLVNVTLIISKRRDSQK